MLKLEVKMAGKLRVFFLVTLVCALQATENKDISDETIQQLNDAIREISDLKRQSGQEINAITDVIEQRINDALKPIYKQVKLLKRKVKSAQKKAKRSKVDITECVGAERRGVQKLDGDDITKCGDTVQIKLVHNKLGELGEEIRKLKDAPTTCGKVANLDQCVSLAIKLSQPRTKLRETEISALIKLVKPEKHYSCIDNAADKMQTALEKIIKNWNDCLAKNDLT